MQERKELKQLYTAKNASWKELTQQFGSQNISPNRTVSDLNIKKTKKNYGLVNKELYYFFIPVIVNFYFKIINKNITHRSSELKLTNVLYRLDSNLTGASTN